jgi:hypothetical protein
MPSKNKIRKLVTLNKVDIAQALQSLQVPGKVITDNISAGWVEVGEGNIVRIQTSADIYVAFSDIDAPAETVSVSSSPAVKILAGDSYILCQAKYMRASGAALRLELLEI